MTADPYRYFRIEARELLDQLGKSVLDLDKGPAPDLVARVLRLTHTLKGAARVVKQREIADHAHATEELLAPFRDATSVVPRECLDAVLGLIDAIAERVALLAPPPDPAVPAPLRPVAEEPLPTVHAEMSELDELLGGIAELHAQLAPLRQGVSAMGRARHLVELLLDQRAARTRSGPLQTQALIEELSALVGGLERGLASGVERVDRELSGVRDLAERLRLAPVGSVFTALERTMRDAAQALGRRVAFVGHGGEVRLDAHVLAAIQGALVQVVRNAVAHGIEPERERVAAGKPPLGQVSIAVVRRGRRVVFTAVDDGRGVDLEAVRRAVERKGLLSAEAQRLGPEELLRLLLAGGISTSGTITEVSGRGIGLDVVRAAAERLGGEVDVHTEPGKGTRVTLTVPLSLASIEALLVEASGITAAVPRDAIRRTIRIDAHEVTRTSAGDSIIHEGRVIPFMPLSRVLPGRVQSTRSARAWSALVVQAGDVVVAIGVDRLLGTMNLVIHPLPAAAPATAIVAGASLDAEGNPQLVLDPEALVAEAGRGLAVAAEPEAPRAAILVVDDSLTTRMLEQSILESAGYLVDTANSGEEGLAKAHAKPYALFLVDVEMPGMDGFTFIERTRADPALHHIPAMLVTSRNAPEDRRRGEQVGACAYIVKSEFDQGKLLERIRGLVG